MPSTHTSLYFDIVFSTKNREPWLDEDWQGLVHPYLGGCLRGLGGVAEEVGGTADHVHILASLNATHCLSDLVRDLKHSSSAWLHKEMRRSAFAWQEGYGAFTVSASQLTRVREYVRNQAEHHRQLSFQDE